MLVTTSRKPSQKTRTFVKVLANFMNWDYVPRGKSDVKGFEGKVAVVGERKRNPTSLGIHTIRKKHVLWFTVGEINKLKMDNSPVIFVGNPPFEPTIMDAIPSETKINFDSPKKVLITNFEPCILKFKYKKKSVFRLNLFKVEEE